MGKFIRFVIYAVVLFFVYLVVRGIYDGKITEKSSVSEVVSDVNQEGKKIIKDGMSATKSDIKKIEMTNRPKS